MEKYDYREAMRNDILAYIEENELKNCDYSELYDRLWVPDGVTGNASGSYTFNTWRDEEYLCHNMDLLHECKAEFEFDDSNLMSAEYYNVSIRYYLLSDILSEVLEDLKGNEDEI